MTKILVACVDYPNIDNRALQYVHARNKGYVEAGVHVEVLNFSIEQDYEYEGIFVHSYNTIKKNIGLFHDYILVCHAPNIRNHYRFIKRYRKVFIDIVFFFHGHEIVEQIKAYPKPYDFRRLSVVKKFMLSGYDKLKIQIWKRYFHKKNTISKLVFVSNTLLSEFRNNMEFQQEDLVNRAVVINNSVGDIFEQYKYDWFCSKKYDFITIRSDIDSSVYCIDLVCSIAEQNKNKSFLLIGKGEYFEYNQRPHNLQHINTSLPQEQLIKYINESKVALMPTRRDSQGVMSCELATFGIEVITSDLAVCHEMFDEFENVIMLSESDMEREIIENDFFTTKKITNYKYYKYNTIEKEVELLERVSVRKPDEN